MLGHTEVMVVINHLSKYAHLVPLKTDFNNTVVADKFVQHVVKLHAHDMPKLIVLDRAASTSQFWQQYSSCKGQL